MTMQPVFAVAAALVVVVVVVAGPALAGTPTENPAGGDCFYMRDLRGHTVDAPRTLYLDVAGRFTYRVEMNNDCLALATRSDPIALKSFGASRTVCKPVDLEISGPAGHCFVSKLVRLTPQEAAAVPKRLQP
jgi:hypothetical protein